MIQRGFFRQGIPVYKITDNDSDPTFDEFELLRVKKPEMTCGRLTKS
jgi:hypothetical protein